MDKKTYTIDAKDKVLGRLAAKIAILLRGKNSPDFMPNKDSGVSVLVKNIGMMRFTGKKLEKKIYYRHSGYLGGLKAEKLKDLFAKNPKEVLRKAVLGMLPKNRLRDQQIKRLKAE